MKQKECKEYTKKNKCRVNNHNNWLGYIPNRIEGQRPETKCLAMNILFGRYTIQNGKNAIAHALYKPEPSTFEMKKGDDVICISMNYYNELDKRAKIVLKCFLSKDDTKRYEATKYFENKKIGVAEGGDDWRRFFIQVSFLDFVKGEKVRLEDL